ncbi:DUF3526 domain-containing protein [Aquincola tertiaricarbonis]|uniref:DUF3526 domain-containing protein n=1 Tax=Aquincola tertiaricarbonis TaxID=391953 RepID=UPI0006150B0A|nr:DUF3526 domain-containing protein [Aquincola tertiaricarbonis]
MSGLMHEARLLLRARTAGAALVLLLVLSSLAVLAGSREVARQRHLQQHLVQLQQQSLQAQAPRLTRSGDVGSAAYYTFHATWDPPSSAAFLALGLRDASPHVLRVRALALQAQLHEGETFNPELALAGRFDYAFVLVYLAPLLLIALLHDLVSAERHAGRLGLLLSLPGGTGRRLWLRRAGLRSALAVACLALPVLAGGLYHGCGAATLAGVLLATAAYMAFWAGLSLVVACRAAGSVASATRLVGAWVLLTLLLPTLAQSVLARMVPVHQGVQLMLAQRQAVHGAWDEPREATLERFFRSHPQWRDTAPLPTGFHWKWYFAFQQLGDEQVAAQFADYRASLQARQRWTAWLGGLLPGVGLQVALHRQAHTDLLAQLAYQDAIATFHQRLREHYYPYLFRDGRYGSADFAALPRFQPPARAEDAPVGSWLGLVLAALLALAAGVRCAGQVRMWMRTG